MEKITAIPGQRDAAVYGGDCIDILMAPNGSKSLYYQIVVDWKGNSYDAINKVEEGKRVADKSWNPAILTKTAVNKNDWTIEIAIPLKELSVKEGDFIDINVCRSQVSKKEYSSWMPCKESFHEAENRARLWLNRRNPPPLSMSAVSFSAPCCGNATITVTVLDNTKQALSAKQSLVLLKDGKPVFKTEKALSVGAGKTADVKLDCLIKEPGSYVMALSLTDMAGKELETKSYKFQVPEILDAKLDSDEYFSDRKTAILSLKLNLGKEELKKCAVAVEVKDSIGNVLNSQKIQALGGNSYALSLDTAGIPADKENFVVVAVVGKGVLEVARKELKFKKISGAFDF